MLSGVTRVSRTIARRRSVRRSRLGLSEGKLTDEASWALRSVFVVPEEEQVGAALRAEHPAEGPIRAAVAGRLEADRAFEELHLLLVLRAADAVHPRILE